MTKLQLALNEDKDYVTRYVLTSIRAHSVIYGLVPDAPGKERARAAWMIMEQAAGLEISKPITPELLFEITSNLYYKAGWVAHHWQGMHETKCTGCGDARPWSSASIAEVLTSWVFFHGTRCATADFYCTLGAIARTQSDQARLETAALLIACEAIYTKPVISEMRDARCSPFEADEFQHGMALLFFSPTKFNRCKYTSIVNGISELEAASAAYLVYNVLKEKELQLVGTWFNETHVLPCGVAKIVIGYLVV
jgi:hypothetical protein